MVRYAILGVLLAAAACSKSEGGGGELFGAPSGPASPAIPGSGSSGATGSGSGATGSGSGTTGSGSGTTGGGSGAAVGSARANGSGAIAGPGSGGGSAAGAGFSADLARELGSGPAGRAGAQSGDAPGAGSATGVAAAAVAPPQPEVPRGRVGGPRRPAKMTAELAAIKLSLLPNWDRDATEPGTFQYVVRIKGTQSTKTFTFRYGYDDASAPADRDAYKKYLQASKQMVGEIKERQRGAAWFLEGNDGSGPAFRYVVLYGGRRLICYGSMYRDAESSRLGDDRDQTVIQAKQICETLAL